VFGDDFNQPIEHLPPNITRLTFGYDFNQPLDHLPHSVTKLHLNYHYHHHQPVDHFRSIIQWYPYWILSAGEYKSIFIERK
jgi:hypothetical protein